MTTASGLSEEMIRDIAEQIATADPDRANISALRRTNLWPGRIKTFRTIAIVILGLGIMASLFELVL